MNTTHIKIESDALVCMICAAVVIGYALGIQKMVNVIKPHQYNKCSQTNLSELAEFLTSNHMIVYGGDSVQNCEEMKMNEGNHSVVESKIVEEGEGEGEGEGQCQGIKYNKENENPNENVSEIIVNNSGNVNNSEEEYEVVTGNIKKSEIKYNKTQYYFSWFDSMF